MKSKLITSFLTLCFLVVFTSVSSGTSCTLTTDPAVDGMCTVMWRYDSSTHTMVVDHVFCKKGAKNAFGVHDCITDSEEGSNED